MPLENQIRREDIGYKLSKALELKGQGTPTLQLDSIVVPVVLVEDLSAGNEQDFQIHRWARGWGSSPADTQYGKLSFNNHADSGILVKVYEIELFHMYGGLGGQVGVTIEPAFATGTQINFSKSFLDARIKQGGPASPARLPTVDIRFDNSSGLGAHFARPFVPAAGAGAGFHMNLGGLILRPGTRLHFEALDINAEFNAHVEWTETNL